MGVFQRIADVMSANINDMLDKAENPEKMAKQYLRQAMDDLAEVKRNTASVLADEKRCKRNLDEANAQVTKYLGLAQKAVTAGNDNDARVFLAEKNKAAQVAEAAQAAYDAAKANADKMRALYSKLNNDVATLQNRLKNVQSMSAVADAQKTVAKMTDKDYGGGLAKFNAMEDRIRQELDASTASMELAAEPTSEAEALAEKYGTSGSDIDAELAALKSQMGVGADSSVEDELASMKAEAGAKES